MVKEIERRVELTQLRQDMVTEWQTKTIVSFISATIRVEKGQKNPLAQAAKEMQFVTEERYRRLTGRSRDSKRAPAPRRPTADTSLDEIIEKGSPTAADANSRGSMEALMQGFGPPT